MSRTAISIFIILSIISSSQAQYPLDHNRDKGWVFGYGNFPPDWGASIIDFNNSPPSISYDSIPIYFRYTYSSLCDQEGNLLFFTNGQHVADKSFHIMPGLDSLNPGNVFDNNGFYGYTVVQGSIALPSLYNHDIYYLVHTPLTWTGEPSPYTYLTYNALTSEIDMTLNEGLGDLSYINMPLVNDTLIAGKFSACRHANGRDWWILFKGFLNNKFYRVLLDPGGFHVQGVQEIGEMVWDGLGQACFSPDGSKFVIYAGYDDIIGINLDVYDFDRCTGLLSDPKHYNYSALGNAFGCAISPNSRYLYLSNVSQVKQCDLEADDVLGSCEVVLTSPLQSLVTSVDMRGLEEGMYFYEIRDKEGRAAMTGKIVNYE